MKKNQPLISIIIPTYNRGNLLRRCLKSVLSQKYENWEAIVVDNYSQDNTDDIIKEFCDSRIKFYKNHNYGVISISRNFGIEKSKGEWICFLDSDDYWLPNKLNYIVRNCTKYDLIYHGYYTYKNGLLGSRKKKESFYTIKANNVSYLLQRGDPINPSCSAVSRAFIGTTRFSEDSNFFAIEDYDFFLQLIIKNPRILHLKKYLTFYDSSTGVSHITSESLKRQRLIIDKYQLQLSKKGYRNVICLYLFNKGVGYYEKGEYKKALRLFKLSVNSSIMKVKKLSLGALVLSAIKSLSK